MANLKELMAASAAKKAAEAEQKQEEVTSAAPVETAKPNPFDKLKQLNKPAPVAPKPEAKKPDTSTDLNLALATDFTFDSQPDEFEPQTIEDLQKAFDILANNFDNKDLISDSLANILTTIRNTPHAANILKPEHFGLMIRGLRESYGVAINKKETKQKKRAASAKEVEEISGIMKDMGLDQMDWSA